jgi:hypothetical protein
MRRRPPVRCRGAPTDATRRHRADGAVTSCASARPVHQTLTIARQPPSRLVHATLAIRARRQLARGRTPRITWTSQPPHWPRMVDEGLPTRRPSDSDVAQVGHLLPPPLFGFCLTSLGDLHELVARVGRSRAKKLAPDVDRRWCWRSRRRCSRRRAGRSGSPWLSPPRRRPRCRRPRRHSFQRRPPSHRPLGRRPACRHSSRQWASTPPRARSVRLATIRRLAQGGRLSHRPSLHEPGAGRGAAPPDMARRRVGRAPRLDGLS